MTAVTIFVCVSCRRRLGEDDESFDQPGRGLADAIEARLQGDGQARLAVTAVDCLAVCKRPCTVAFSGADKWTYLIGDLDPESHVDEIVVGGQKFRGVGERHRSLAGAAGVLPQGRDRARAADQSQGEAMSALAKVPCTIVTGFLGAGKTTLVRHVLENADGRRLAVIVNEFGDVGIDGEILKSCGIESCSEDSIVELANGCICCTVADDFVPALKALLDRPSPPEHIVIETSGLALPKPLVKAFNWPEIASRVTVDGVVAVVDGAAVAAGRFADDPEAIARQRAQDPSLDHDNPLEEVYEDQLLCADLVILNKADLMSSAERHSVTGEIGRTLPRAVKVVEAENGQVPIAILLGLGAKAESDLANRPSHHDLEGEHDHDDFDTFIIDLPAVRLAAGAGRPHGEGGRGARCAAHEGLRRDRRQADAAPGAGRGVAHPAPVRPQVAIGRAAPRPAGGDRRDGFRQGCHPRPHPGVERTLDLAYLSS